ncbi:hypothetical protein TeGR_g14530 [Tetraparma gracilis]|uniref:Sfi1 spindle body domain-containing protein n=1 Tax=Tetraparma gracilis TaxID=2962635 RepID=A0ABQ6M4D6_9STRA|nr:hypothetical protein TeGR_g14530 [Tetraparma gracilis]
MSLLILIVRNAFRSIRAPYDRWRRRVLAAKVTALRAHADESLRLSRIALSKADSFYFLFYAGKSFRSWRAHYAATALARMRLAEAHHAAPYLAAWVSRARLALRARSFRARRSHRLLLTVLNLWRCVLYHLKRAAAMGAANRKRRARRRLRAILRALRRHAERNKRVYRFALLRYSRIARLHFGAWKKHTEERERHRRLAVAGDRAHATAVLRRSVGKMRALARSRVANRDRRARAASQFKRSTFRSFARAVQEARRGKEMVGRHLLFYVVGKKVLPAWRGYADRSIATRKYARYFTLSYFFTKWDQFVDDEGTRRATALAKQVLWDHERVFVAFNAWTAAYRRGKRLFQCERYLSANRERKMKTEALRAWAELEMRRKNCRDAGVLVERLQERKLLLGATTIWRAGMVHRRAERMSALLLVWRTFCDGSKNAARSRENKELADRYRYATMLKSGVKALHGHAHTASYLRACHKVAEATFFKTGVERGLRQWRRFSQASRLLSDRSHHAQERRAFRVLKKNLGDARLAATRELLVRVVTSWKETTTKGELVREGKLAKLRGVFGERAEKHILKAWRGVVLERRAETKHWWVLWLVYLNSKSQEGERRERAAEEVGGIILRSKWKVWRDKMVLANYDRSRATRVSSKLKLRKVFEGIRKHAMFALAEKKALAKFARHVVETNRQLFVRWRDYVRHVVSERKRLVMLRHAEARAEALGRRRDKSLASAAIAAWAARVRGWMEKRDTIGRAESWREERGLRLALGDLREWVGRERRMRIAGTYWEGLEERRMKQLLGGWRDAAGEGRREIGRIRGRGILRRWKANAADRRAVWTVVTEFRAKKEAERMGMVVKAWGGYVRTST